MAVSLQTRRMDTRAVRDKKTSILAFILGSAVFVIPVGMLSSRNPAVTTTDFHMEPSMVAPGQEFEAVWTDVPMRDGCTGIVYRRFTGMRRGQKTSWVQPAVHVVQHGVIGEPEQFRTTWRVPNMDPGTEGFFNKTIRRWCNPFQAWLWTMDEVQEASFSVVESISKPNRP